MDASVRSRSTRDRPAKAPLSEAAIVDAALAVARADGLAAVTMRRVAAELDTGAASLYVYVRNRDELLHAMLDRVAGEVPLVEAGPEALARAAPRPARRLPRGARNLPRPGDGAAGGTAGDRQLAGRAREPARADGRRRDRAAGRGLGLRQPDADRHRDGERGRRPQVRPG